MIVASLVSKSEEPFQLVNTPQGRWEIGYRGNKFVIAYFSQPLTLSSIAIDKIMEGRHLTDKYNIIYICNRSVSFHLPRLHFDLIIYISNSTLDQANWLQYGLCTYPRQHLNNTLDVIMTSPLWPHYDMIMSGKHTHRNFFSCLNTTT